MCRRAITFVIRAACRSRKSLFLIETSGVWELTEWSLSHHCFLYHITIFSHHLCWSAESCLWWCDSYPSPSKSLPSDGTSKLLASYPTSRKATSPTSEASTQKEESSLPIPVSELKMPQQEERQGRNTVLWHCVKTGSQHYASRQTKI